MRIAHIADTHIGFSAYRRSDPETGINQREVDVYKAFQHLVDSILRNKPDVVVHAGDLFDSVRPSNRALSVVLEQLLRLSEAGVQVVLVAGNHSTPRLRETGSVFRLFEHIDGVHAFYTPGLHRLQLGELEVVAFPHQDKEPMIEALRSWERGRARYEVGVLHAGVQGLTRYSLGEANELNLPTSLLNLKADYIALGHFHGMERITENAWYSGSLERFSFAEVDQEKGYMLVDLDRGSRQFVKLPTRPMYSLGPIHARGKDASRLQEELASALSSVPMAGALVRMRVEAVPAALYRSLDLNALRAMGEKAVHLELDFEIVQATGAVQWRTASVGSLEEEFQTYLSQVPVEGVDREELRRRGLEYLRRGMGE